MLRQFLFTLTLSLLFSASAFAGAAICIADGDLPSGLSSDVEYFVRWDSQGSGYDAESAARRDYEQKYDGLPSCRNTRNMENGHFVVIKNNLRNYKGEIRTTYAFGYGTTYQSALKDAEEEMGRRNWSWKRSDGYSIEMSKNF